MVTLAIHKRMRRWLFGRVGSSIPECEQRSVRTSQGCKEAVIENVASNLMKKTEKKEDVELYYDFQKAYDNVNHAFLERLLDVYRFQHGIQMPTIEMMAPWKIRLSYGAKKEVGEVRLENGIIKGDALSPLLFVPMTDPLVEVLNRVCRGDAEILYHMNDLKASSAGLEKSMQVHETEEIRQCRWDGDQFEEERHPDERPNPNQETFQEILRQDDRRRAHLHQQTMPCKMLADSLVD